MDLKIKAMTILAIFCLLISAGSACAAEDIATNSDDVLSIDMDNNVIGVDESTGDIADDGVPYHADGTNATGNASGDRYDDFVPQHADGTNATGGFSNETGNTTSSGNSTNGTVTTHTLPATGNPILALLAVCSLIGVYTIKRK